MQSADFDLICLGAGPAGQKAAIQAAKAGFRACIIERETQVGGSCLLSGTIPSKALREQALRYRRIRGSVTSLAVELIRGKGTFLDAHRIEVQHLDGTRCVVQSPRVVLATGSRPGHVPAIEVDH